MTIKRTRKPRNTQLPALVSASKFMSYVLRHDPQAIGLLLDPEGWAQIEDLVRLSQVSRTPLTNELIAEVARTSDKKRFSISADGLSIRANQGHSITVDLNLEAKIPPDILFHGTAHHFLTSIASEGLVRGSRHHVHLSLDRETAEKVGRRHGAPVVLVVLAGFMHRDGCLFYLSENGVWLTDRVPPQYIREATQHD